MTDLTERQREVLSLICDAPKGCTTISDIAFFIGASNQTAGRVVQTLSALNLATRQRWNNVMEIWPTDEGRKVREALKD